MTPRSESVGGEAGEQLVVKLASSRLAVGEQLVGGVELIGVVGKAAVESRARCQALDQPSRGDGRGKSGVLPGPGPTKPPLQPLPRWQRASEKQIPRVAEQKIIESPPGRRGNLPGLSEPFSHPGSEEY